ncbi:primase-like DNA-binding domain-containing protein [Streptomyces klenkii]
MVDLLGKFIAENIERDINSFELTDDLYKRYLKYCSFYKIESLTRLKFGNQLKKFNVGIYDKRRRKVREGKVGRWGVRLLPCKY